MKLYCVMNFKFNNLQKISDIKDSNHQLQYINFLHIAYLVYVFKIQFMLLCFNHIRLKIPGTFFQK